MGWDARRWTRREEKVVTELNTRPRRAGRVCVFAHHRLLVCLASATGRRKTHVGSARRAGAQRFRAESQAVVLCVHGFRASAKLGDVFFRVTDPAGARRHVRRSRHRWQWQLTLRVHVVCRREIRVLLLLLASCFSVSVCDVFHAAGLQAGSARHSV
jgi:hypothetical protein